MFNRLLIVLTISSRPNENAFCIALLLCIVVLQVNFQVATLLAVLGLVGFVGQLLMLREVFNLMRRFKPVKTRPANKSESFRKLK